MPDESDSAAWLGVVSFLNARPLIEGLEDAARVHLQYAVPAALPEMLRDGRVDAALIPTIDLAREQNSWQRISDAGICCDGETLTVRVFSRVPPEHMTTLYADTDSHTSVALARLLWSRKIGRPLTIEPLDSANGLDACESVLLIGDKVVSAPVSGFSHEIDLGRAWKEWTGLPFVFAVWAARADGDYRELARQLSEARDRGVARTGEIAARFGPACGWPVTLAREYLAHRLKYTVTPEAGAGMQHFLELAASEGIIQENGALVR